MFGIVKVKDLLAHTDVRTRARSDSTPLHLHNSPPIFCVSPRDFEAARNDGERRQSCLNRGRIWSGIRNRSK